MVYNHSTHTSVHYSTFWVGCPDRTLQSVIGKKVIAVHGDVHVILVGKFVQIVVVSF